MREWTFNCADCGVETTARSPKAFLCRECAAKRNTERWKKQDEQRRVQRALNPDDPEVHFCDSPEHIQECLNCEKPYCNNCHAGHFKEFPQRRKRPTYLTDVKMEVLACFKKGMTAIEISDKFKCQHDTVYSWKRKLKKEGLL